MVVVTASVQQMVPKARPVKDFRAVMGLNHLTTAVVEVVLGVWVNTPLRKMQVMAVKVSSQTFTVVLDIMAQVVVAAATMQRAVERGGRSPGKGLEKDQAVKMEPMEEPILVEEGVGLPQLGQEVAQVAPALSSFVTAMIQAGSSAMDLLNYVPLHPLYTSQLWASQQTDFIG